MARIFITGTAEGLGRAAAETLLGESHEVIVHARTTERLAAVEALVDRGASAVAGDLADGRQTRAIADHVNQLGPVDAVIHNAGVSRGPQVLPVNVVAPYLLTALIDPSAAADLPQQRHAPRRTTPSRRPRLERTTRDRLLLRQQVARDHAGCRRRPALARRVQQRRRPRLGAHQDGRPRSPDDLRLGHLTQEWLATSNEPDARGSGGYWYHQRRRAPHPAVLDPEFQDDLLAALATFTGAPLASGAYRESPIA
jgi:hypothetical protein